MRQASKLLERGKLLAVVLVLGLIASCTTPSGDNGASHQDNPVLDLVIGATAQPQTMDLTSNNGAAIPQVLLYNVYETLVKIDSEGKIRPLLAQEWTVSEEGTLYTFTLQPKARFASGAPVDADAVVASMELLRSGEQTTDVLKQQMSVVQSTTAIDESTVEVKLSRPSNNWLFYMTQTAGIVIDPAGMSTLATQPMGSGPFKFRDWTKGQAVTLEKNSSYWGTPARFDTATFRYFADPNAQNTAMLAGDLDIISNVQAPQSLSMFENDDRFTIIEGTTNGEVVLGMNVAQPPFNDLRVRQAILSAIDREALMNTVWSGRGTLIGSMVPPTDPWYEDLSQTYPFDPEKARQLLAEAGYSNDLVLRLRVPTLPYATAAAQFITSQLRDVGITVQVEELEFPARWLDEVFSKADYDMTIVAHVEPRDIVQFGDPEFYWRYDSPQLQELLAQADAGTPDEQVELMKQSARLIAEDAAAGFLFLLPNLVVTESDITGVAVNATGLSFDLTTIASSNA